ncbi:MAG: insulinase family protein [Bacilli bacterium]|nr:insulinase family protein [Bacilli bacterium]
MEYVQKDLKSYKLHMIKTDKFKTVMVKVYFREPIKKENITKRSFLTTMLNLSSKKYPSKRLMALHSQDLYSCRISSVDSRLGNYLNTSFSLNVLNDEYTENGNLIEAIKFLGDVIYDPDVDDEAFSEKSFNIVMNQAVLALSSIKEDSKSYSLMRMLEEMDDGPISYRSIGYIEDLQKITPKSLYEYYLDILSKDMMDVFVIGNIDFDQIEKVIRSTFKSKVFKKIRVPYIVEEKKAPHNKNIVKESNDSNQSKLAVGLRVNSLTDYERNYPMSLFNIIFGGGPDSKLFHEVREKNSLAYYIGSIPNKLDNVILIRAGITRDNFDMVLKLIEKELSNMSKGKFSDEDINKAKEMYTSAIDEIYESKSRIIESYYMMELLGVDDIDTKKEKMQKVTKEEIVKVAKKVKIDTVYMLEGDKE